MTTWVGAAAPVPTPPAPPLAVGAWLSRPQAARSRRSAPHPLPPPAPAELELDLDAMAFGGEAIGRYDGQVVFVPYALPGERVRVAIERAKKGYSRTRLLEVLRPAPQRV